MTSTTTTAIFQIPSLIYLDGKSIGLGGDIDQCARILSKGEREIAKRAYNNGSDSKNAGDSYPVWLVPLCFCFASYSMYKILTHQDTITNPGATALFALAIFVATYVFTDFVSGVFHLVLDNPNNIGQFPIDGMCRGFQEHHLDPTLIYKMDLFNHCRVMGSPLFFVFVLNLPLEYLVGKTMLNFHIYYLCISFMLIYMQLCHRWAHLPPHMRTAPIRLLQSLKLAVAPGAHLNHHGAPFLTDFCIMNGVTNPLLNLIVQIPAFHPHKKIWALLFCAVSYSPNLLCFFTTF